MFTFAGSLPAVACSCTLDALTAEVSRHEASGMEGREGNNLESFIIFLFVGVFPVEIFILFYLLISWLYWVFVAAHGLSVVAASRGYSSLWCVGFSLRWLLL